MVSSWRNLKVLTEANGNDLEEHQYRMTINEELFHGENVQ